MGGILLRFPSRSKTIAAISGIQSTCILLPTDRHLINTIYQPRFPTLTGSKAQLQIYFEGGFFYEQANIVIGIGVVALAIGATTPRRPVELYIQLEESEDS